MISSAVRLTSSSSMIVRLMWFLQGRCSLAAPRARSRSMNRCADPSMIWLPLRPRKPRIGRPIVRLPPRKPRLSTSITRRPSPAAASAAMMPAGPPPTTRTSASARTGMSRAGSFIVFIAIRQFIRLFRLRRLGTHHLPQHDGCDDVERTHDREERIPRFRTGSTRRTG